MTSPIELMPHGATIQGVKDRPVYWGKYAIRILQNSYIETGLLVLSPSLSNSTHGKEIRNKTIDDIAFAITLIILVRLELPEQHPLHSHLQGTLQAAYRLGELLYL